MVAQASLPDPFFPHKPMSTRLGTLSDMLD